MRLSFWQYLAFFTLPTLAYLALAGLIASVLVLRLSPWLAVPLGLILGAIILALWIAGQGGTSTVVELNIASVILLMLLGYLASGFVQIRHRALHRHYKAAPHRPVPSIAKP